MTPSNSQTSTGLSAHFAWDGSVAAGLAVAIAIVFIIDLTSKPPEIEEGASEPVVTTEKPPGPEPVRLRIAVTKPQFDDMGRLLTSLGSGYQYTTIDDDALLDEARLREIDVLFFTCGGVPKSWVAKVLGEAERGQVSVEIKEEIYRRTTENLRRFVDRGGVLYASDERYPFIASAFEEMRPSHGSSMQMGEAQTVKAEVVDSGLRGLVGEQIPLNFDKSGWMPAAFDEEKVSVLMRGPFTGLGGGEFQSPLLVRFKSGEGAVIFTSFHNEKVNGEVAVKLLKYLVFATMLAKTEEETAQIISRGGLVAKGKSLLSASSADPSVSQTYKCTKAGPLRFVLGFEDRGGKMKLTVVAPSGHKYEKEGVSTFQIDIPDATVGNWKYTITAMKMPFDNFPYSLSIGAK